MKKNYFQRVRDITPTKFWVNNVTPQEAKLGIESGATGCTQNPSYTWKMLTHPKGKDQTVQLLRETLAETADDNEAECILQRKLVRAVSDEFMALWESSRGQYGYVSIQGDPVHEEDPQVIIDEARKNREMNPNIMIKIPATKAGLEAMNVLVAENTPLNATEVMGLSQVITLCDMYETVSKRSGQKPVMYISLITGIFDEWLSQDVREKRVEVNQDALYQAGMIIAKKVYQEMHDRRCRMGFIGGGVRGLQHFTEMVGADACITMNWEGQGSCTELIEADLPVVSRFHNPVQPRVLDELLRKVPEFSRAYYEDGLAIEEYEHYGPVEYFRNSFIKNWENALNEIATQRAKS